ncbi:MAG: anthranilate synthase component I family protein [Bacteroidales bacterium]
MRKFASFTIDNKQIFMHNALQYAHNTYKHVIALDSSGYSNDKYSRFDFLIAIDAMQTFSNNRKSLKNASEIKDWTFGYIAYDFKNELEALKSDNTDNLNCPNINFFQARYVILCKENTWKIEYDSSVNSESEALALIAEIKNTKIRHFQYERKVDIQARVSKQRYIQQVQKIISQIHAGNIYELNYCVEFFAKGVSIEPLQAYKSLNSISPTPLAAFLKLDDISLMCASPERYICKQGKKLISQPIKGTIKRSKNEYEDNILRLRLQNDTKERAENIMIVDIVRNDLSKVTQAGSVKVEELCGVYPFKQVSQMISTIVGELDHCHSAFDAICASFPMGSMTGAPKHKTMQLIEKYEDSKRGIYSGAMGYFAPNGDFDFNVVIRSAIYNSLNQYLSFSVGSAITARSDANREYDECKLKAKALLEVLSK